MKMREIAEKASEAFKKIFGRQQAAKEDAEGQQDEREAVQEGEKGQQEENLPSETGKAAEGQIKAPKLEERHVKEIELVTGAPEVGIKNFMDDLADAVVAITKNLAPAVELVKKNIAKLNETLVMINAPQAKRKKAELWKRYCEEKGKMSNNERRRKGLPMVRRPKRSQYMTKKRKEKGR